MSLERIEELLNEIEPRIEELNEIAETFEPHNEKRVGDPYIKLQAKIQKLTKAFSAMQNGSSVGGSGIHLFTQSLDDFPESMLDSTKN